jgi:hypothetical protein
MDNEASADDKHRVDGREDIDDGDAGGVRRDISKISGVCRPIDRGDAVRGLRMGGGRWWCSQIARIGKQKPWRLSSSLVLERVGRYGDHETRLEQKKNWRDIACAFFALHWRGCSGVPWRFRPSLKCLRIGGYARRAVRRGRVL